MGNTCNWPGKENAGAYGIRYGFKVGSLAEHTKFGIKILSGSGLREGPMGRFTKAAMMKALSNKMEKIRREFKFNPDNGTSQIRGALGSPDAAVAYGRYRECEFLLIEIEEGRLQE